MLLTSSLAVLKIDIVQKKNSYLYFQNISNKARVTKVVFISHLILSLYTNIKYNIKNLQLLSLK